MSHAMRNHDTLLAEKVGLHFINGITIFYNDMQWMVTMHIFRMSYMRSYLYSNPLPYDYQPCPNVITTVRSQLLVSRGSNAGKLLAMLLKNMKRGSWLLHKSSRIPDSRPDEVCSGKTR